MAAGCNNHIDSNVTHSSSSRFVSSMTGLFCLVLRPSRSDLRFCLLTRGLRFLWRPSAGCSSASPRHNSASACTKPNWRLSWHRWGLSVSVSDFYSMLSDVASLAVSPLSSNPVTMALHRPMRWIGARWRDKFFEKTEDEDIA